MALPGTIEQPHFDRAAFKVRRIYAMLASDGQTANFKFTPDEQDFKCQFVPHIFQPVENAWGRQGWTVVQLLAATEADLMAALTMAQEHATRKASRKG